MRFFYVAQDKSHALSRGEIEVKNRDEAIATLSRRGLTPVKLDLVAEGKRGSTLSRFASVSIYFGSNLTTFDQIIIIRQLGTILNTGTDILSALQIIAQDTEKPSVRRVIYDIKDRVGRGESFSDAVKAWEYEFNPIFVNLVKAAEASGNLPSVLLSYAQELRKDYNFTRKMKGSLVYPIILVVAMAAMIIIILSVVTPRLKELFVSLHTEPPFYTKIFFVASDLWLAYTIPLSILFGIIVVFLIVASRSKRFRCYLALALWHLPFLNKIQKNLALMRFAKTVSNLLKAGFSLRGALLVTGEVINPSYQRAIKDIAEKRLEEGVSFANALAEHPDLFPGILLSVVATGEKSGQLAPVLLQMAEFYEEEITYSLELILTLIEPVLLVVVGIIVGLLAGSLIAPIYRVIGRF